MVRKLETWFWKNDLARWSLLYRKLGSKSCNFINLRLMVKVNFIILMAISIKDNGQMIKLMVMDVINIVKKMEFFFKEIGTMIYKMDMELKYGLINVNMKVNT